MLFIISIAKSGSGLVVKSIKNIQSIQGGGGGGTESSPFDCFCNWEKTLEIGKRSSYEE